MRNQHLILTLALAAFVPAALTAQTTTPGPGIDVEIVNPVDGGNNFCAQLGSPFWAAVWVRPGDQNTTCSLGCGSVGGGTAAIATAAVAVEFDPAKLAFAAAETNPDPSFAAVDGLVASGTAAAGRIGWSLAGDWLVNGDPSSGLAGPCTQQLLDSHGWVFRVQLQPISGGSSLIGLPRQPDFALSFADHCGTAAFTISSSDLDELVPGFVTTSCSSLADILFADGFETGTPARWSSIKD
ncbi:MAG: hypothetical protein V2I67_07910 [Thermoanaerobaculales bacterium]|jgi:hypothetical protein|nr:hypothetical protein [Thermoanaerobaculales bacterium]